MTGLSPIDTDRATSLAIHDLGSAFMLHRETAGRGTGQGYENPFAFYFAGRGGVLGDVDAEVIYSAFGWFAPTVVRPMWEAGVAVHGAQGAADRYFAACADWGRDHLSEVDGLDRFVGLAETVVAAAETSGRSLFAGWKGQPRAEDAAARAMQLVHVMREWRGSTHLVATTATGLTPLEAIVAGDGDDRARFFGWTGDLPAVTDEMRARRREAEDMTDRLCGAAYEALTGAERAEFVELVGVLAKTGEG